MGRSRLWTPVPLRWEPAAPNADGLLETLHPADGWQGVLDRGASAPPTRLSYVIESPRREEYGLPYVGIRHSMEDGEDIYEVRVRADTPSGTRYHTCQTRAHAQEWAEGWFHRHYARAR